MGSTVCKLQFDYTLNSSTPVCNFEEWPFLKSLAEEHVNNWVPVFFSAAGVLCLLFLWVISFCIHYRDITKSFIVCQLVPYTLAYLPQFIANLYDRITYDDGCTDSNYCQPGQWYSWLYTTKNFAVTTIGINLPLGAACFIMMNILAANKRKLLSFSATGMYFFILIFSTLVGLSNFLTVNDGYNTTRSVLSTLYNWLVRVSMSCCTIFLFIILFVACCCSKPRLGQSREPTVSNAKSRMCWTIPFVLVTFLPLSYGLTVTDLFRFIRNTYGYNMFWMFYHSFILVDMLDPIIFSCSTVLFLPAYRSALFGRQGYKKGKNAQFKSITPVTSVSNIESLAHQLNETPTISTSAPAVSKPTNQVRGQYDANLVAILTTPTAMYTHAHLMPTTEGMVHSCSPSGMPSYITTQSYPCPQHSPLLQPTISVPQINAITSPTSTHI